MQLKVQIIIESDDDAPPIIEEIACFEREEATPATLGVTLAKAKDLLARLQDAMVVQQVATYVEQQRRCPTCGTLQSYKGRHQIVYRTLFGKLHLASPRLYCCPCQAATRHSFSPLADLLPTRTAPELQYLQAKWASLMSYGLTVDLLEEVLPIHVGSTTVVRQLHGVAERVEEALGEEAWSMIEGCQAVWDQLPIPDGPLTVGIDGGYIHARDGTNRKAGWFEAIVSKSIPTDRPSKCMGFVTDYDAKPKRRLFEMLKAHGLQMNQGITFLSDGGDTVRELQLYLSPTAEHLLDWWHVAMRITGMQQLVPGARAAADGDDLCNLSADLERVKWYVWHGNVFRALQVLDDLQLDLDIYDDARLAIMKLEKAVKECQGYIAVNRAFIPNYGDHYRHGETISTAFVESTVNQVTSRRFVKKQQMRWTKRSAHLLLQVRTQVLNDDLRGTFTG